MSAERLVDDLWASATTEVRRNTLQSKVAMLRRALGPAAVVSRDGGYALEVEPADVDALAVLRAATTAAELREGGQPDRAAELCESVLRLFRGVPLQAAADAEWANVFRTRLDEAHIVLLEVSFWARLQLGAAGGVIGELEGAVASHPFQEGLWELLVAALYRAGRQADALAAYQRVRTHLADELGLDPGPGLQRLERKILAQDPAAHPLPDAPGPARSNLPSMSPALVGRETEVADLVELVARERLVELIGPGGIGKTAVALDVGRRLAGSQAGADGVWLARLENAVTATDVVDVLVAALQGPGGEAALFERLRRGSTLVILDNCEHVVEAVSELAVRLLDHAPSLRILCTSQLPLDIDGECLVELAPLELADAVALFRRRASRLTSTAQGDEDVLDLCRSLDGLPLAIELAAARTRTLTVEEITRRLDDRFAVLSDPSSRRPERRRSLRSTIGWSYDLLFPDDQRGLWALAAFAGGAPLAAVEFVLEALGVPATAAIDVVDRLATDRWSRCTTTTGAPPADLRYRLLDSIRAFALESMTERGTVRAALGAHAQWYADAAAGSTAGVRSAEQAEHLCFARTERANIDAALAWSVAHDPRRALDVASGFGWAWVVLGDSRGAERILAALDAAAGLGRGPSSGPARCCWPAGSRRRPDDLALAREHVRAASDHGGRRAKTSTCRPGPPTTWRTSSRTTVSSGSALALTDRSRAIYDALDRPWDQAANALFAARAAISAGDEPRSVETVAEVERWLAVVDDPWLRSRGEAVKGELARAPAPVRRRGHPPQVGRGDLAAARLPPDRGLPAVQPRPGAVPGRRLRGGGHHAWGWRSEG